MNNLAKLGDTVVEVSGVVHDEFRGLFFLLEWQLTGLAPAKFRFVPAAVFHDSGQAGFEWHIDKNQLITQVVPAGFQHHGGVDKDDIVLSLSLPDLSLHLSTNLGVNDGLQLGE